jgi:hypothetical protein
MPVASVSKETASGNTIGNNIDEKGKGERKTVGLGIGAGLYLNEVGVKVMVMGEKGTVETSRTGKNEKGVEATSKGEFGTTGIGFGAKAEYRVALNKKANTNIIPNVGFTAMSVKRDKYEEKGGANAVRVEGMNYTKSIVDAGVNVEKKEKKYKLKAGVGVNLTVSGEKGKAKGYGNTSFYGETDAAGLKYDPGEESRAKLESKSTDQGKVVGTANVGAEYALSRRVNVGLELSAEKGKNSQSVTGKVNAKYDLGRKRYYGRSLRIAKKNVVKVLKERKEYVQEELEKKKEELAKAKKK